MLVLSRNVGQAILAGSVRIKVLAVRGKRVKLGLVAARDVPIHRTELLPEVLADGETRAPLWPHYLGDVPEEEATRYTLQA